MGEFKYQLVNLFFVAIFFVQNGHVTSMIPDFIHPCHEGDNVCMLKSVQDAVPEFVKGIPEMGVPTLDPFYIDKISIPLEGLKFTFYDGRVSGFRKAVIDKAESSLEKLHLIMDFHSNLTLKGKYSAKGQVLVLPIDGAGDAKIKLTNLKMKMKLKFKFVEGDDGVVHYAVDDYRYKFDYGDQVTFNLTNIFKGNPELSSTVLAFLNENWKVLAEAFGKPIVDYAVELAVRNIEKFFLAVPYNELSLKNSEYRPFQKFNRRVRIIKQLYFYYIVILSIHYAFLFYYIKYLTSI